jgi:hypothetical protein
MGTRERNLKSYHRPAGSLAARSAGGRMVFRKQA